MRWWQTICVGSMCFGLNLSVIAAEWFVSPAGSDTNVGSLELPFQTLAHAVQPLQPGDTLWLRGGTYRETLTPIISGTTNQPVIISSYNGEAVVISGCDEITNAWALTSNGIYTASVAWTLGAGYDQVFVDGIMQHQARHPNHGAGTLFNPILADVTVTNGSAANYPYTITATNFSGKPSGFFAGARFIGGVGYKWSWQTAIISNSSGNRLDVNSATRSTWWWPDYAGVSNTADTGAGFVYGLLNLLDSDGEWHLQTNVVSPHTLYLRITGGAHPGACRVEVKRRNWCVNITNVDYVTIRGLKTQGGAIRLKGVGIVFENNDASYLSHYMVWAHGGYANGGREEGGGIVVSGTGNTVRGCTVHDTAGSGIYSSGFGQYITRNHVYNTDYSGTYASALVLAGEGDVASFNTMHDSGRDILRPIGRGQSVMYNDLYNSGKLCLDLGMIYTFNQNALASNGVRTRIAYNWVHDANPNDTKSNGIYLDNYCQNYTVDHNVIFGLNSSAIGLSVNSPTIGHRLYHNTVIQCLDYFRTWTAFPDSNYETNFWTASNHGMDYLAQNNLLLTNAAAVASNLVNPAAWDFRLKAGASAVNPGFSTNTVMWFTTNGITGVLAPFVLSMRYPVQRFDYHLESGKGVPLPGINNGYLGAFPDDGAYEFGGPVWRPGISGWDTNSPGVQTDPATSLGVTRATIQGTVLSTGGTSITARLYWGPADGGTNRAAWANVVDNGPQSLGSVFSHMLQNLSPSTRYYYRAYVTNGLGVCWGDARNFTTGSILAWDAGGGADANISASSNWESNAVPDLSSGADVPHFGAAGSTATINTNAFFAGLVFDRNADFILANGAGALTLGATGITVALPNFTGRTYDINENSLTLAAEQTWMVSNNTGAAVLNVASGIGDGTNIFGITKAGSGTLALSGSNSYDGITSISCGVLDMSHNNSLGSLLGNTFLLTTGSTNTGGQLRLSGSITSLEDITITGTTETANYALAIDSASGSNTLAGSLILSGGGSLRLGVTSGFLVLDGPVTREGTNAGTFQLNATASNTISVSRPILNNGGVFQVAGAGTVILNAAGNDIGNVQVFFGSPTGPTLRLGAHNALATTKHVILGSTSTANLADRGTLDLGGFNQAVNSLIGQKGTGSTPSPALNRLVTNSATNSISVLTIGNGNGSSTFDGVIRDGAGAISLVKVGAGSIVLTDTNAYTGSTTVSGGVLSCLVACLANNADVYLNTGGVLNLNFTGSDSIDELLLDGVRQRAGTWGGLGSGASNTTALITGPGWLNVTNDRFAVWISSLGSVPVSDCDPEDDPDGDGRSNMSEFIAGSNPALLDGKSLSITNTGSNFAVSFLANDASGTGYGGLTRLFDLLYSTNLIFNTWQYAPGYSNIIGSNQWIIYTNSGVSDQGFYKLQIRLW